MRIVMALVYGSVMVAGWWYPMVALGVFALLGGVVLTGQRRRWCGTMCPRGSFLDLVMARFSPRKPLPRWMVGPWVWKISLGIFLLALVLQVIFTGLWTNFSWSLLGTVFYRMCFVSSAVALPLALVRHQRAWCAVCPVGNLLRK